MTYPQSPFLLFYWFISTISSYNKIACPRLWVYISWFLSITILKSFNLVHAILISSGRLHLCCIQTLELFNFLLLNHVTVYKYVNLCVCKRFMVWIAFDPNNPNVSWLQVYTVNNNRELETVVVSPVVQVYYYASNTKLSSSSLHRCLDKLGEIRRQVFIMHHT